MVAFQARQIHVESVPEVPVPASVADGSAGVSLAASGGSPTGNDPTTDDGSARGDSPATGDGSATGDGPPTVDDTANDNPADVLIVESSQSSDLRFDDPDESDGPAPLPAGGVDGLAGQGNPAATPVSGPDVSSLTGDQHSTTLPFHAEDHWSVNTGGLYLNLDVASTPLGSA